MNDPLPTVTVLIAARPDQQEIQAVAAGRQLDYPREKLQILVARGKQPSIQRNAGLRASRGELIYFLDDDSIPPPGNLRRAAATFADATVQMAGGPNLCPPEAPFVEQVFALVHASWLAFGPSRARYAKVGSARSSSEKELILCNLVARRKSLLELGGFNELLYPNEENALMDELEKRGKLIYDPGLFVQRRPRRSLKSFIKMLLNYGRGRAEQFRLHPTARSAPNFVPPLFCLYLVSLGALCPLLGWPALLPLGFYLLCVLIQAAALMAQGGVLRGFCAIPLIVLTHVVYGIGFGRGLFTKLKPNPAQPKQKSPWRKSPFDAAAMKNPTWSKAVRKCADPQRARHYLDLLAATPAAAALAAASGEQARILCALFSGSAALSGWLVAHPEFLRQLTPEQLQHPRREQGFHRETDDRLRASLASADFPSAFAILRRFKHSEFLRIGARDLAHLANQVEITRELSDLADVCIDAVTGICVRQLTARLGSPFHQDADNRWLPTGFCVFGLGKLGGQELNYNSDVDLVFVYGDEGEVFRAVPRRAPNPAATGTNHAFFNRLSEMIVSELTKMTADGALYRVDLRLRPEGDAGPIARSLPSFENYYAQWGQTWERMMLIKARRVAGDGGLAADFLESVQSFRYPRSVSPGALREVAAIKDRIENEVVRSGELDRNVKLGRGGIREIEFIAQSLQLLHAGQLPFLQVPQTLAALEKLSLYGLLEPAESMKLAAAYDFLRDVEHRLQMEENLQTHTIPKVLAARQRLAMLMGFDLAEEFETARQHHAFAVRKVFDRLFRPDAPEAASPMPREFAGHEAEWARLLAAHSFKNPEGSVRLLNEFANGPGYMHVSNRTSDLALELLRKFLALCPRTDTEPDKLSSPPNWDPSSKTLSDPDRVLTRLDSFITAYGARATLFEMWNSNPALFELLLLLFDRSEFLAEVAIRTPDLVDELVLSGRLRQRKNADEILKDLRHGRNDPDQSLWLRRYHQTEQMRIGLRDILGLADSEQNLVEVTALAEACLQYALEVVLRQLHFRRAPVAIVGFGKLGGAELNYGSDLDLVFVTDAKAAELPKLQPIAIKVLELLSARTEHGSVFVTDARLRPDGEKGLLVNSLDAYEEYYRRRARLWELQALLRSRPVAGNPGIGQRFQSIAAGLTNFTEPNVQAGFPTAAISAKSKSRAKPAKQRKSPARSQPTLGVAAYQPKWAGEIRQMRQRIEKERTPAGQDALAIKTGAGGLMDAEFMAQSFALARGWHEPSTLRALERVREAGLIPNEEAGRFIENYRRLRRVEGILRRWSFEGETVLPDDPAPYYRVSVRCGFRTPDDFRRAVAAWRSAIRATYDRYQPH